jgi:biopolymer transport protein ExbB
MFIKAKRMSISLIFFVCLFASQLSLLAQAAEDAGVEKDAPPPAPGFMSIVFGGSPVDIGIWMMLFGCSAATLAFIIDGMITVKRDKLIPEDLVEGVRESLNEGDLNSAIAACEENPSPLSNILMVGFSNITEGFEVIQDSISAAADYESEKLLQKVNYLNMLGQIAPMLGLLGTVTGMVSAFSGMGTATGSAKATMLASAIAGALWTTCAGLLISVPALLSYTFTRNNAIRIILESESTVIDLIKTLRNAEVDEEEEEEEY